VFFFVLFAFVTNVMAEAIAELGPSDTVLSQEDVSRLLRGIQSGEIDASQSVLESSIEERKGEDGAEEDEMGAFLKDVAAKKDEGESKVRTRDNVVCLCLFNEQTKVLLVMAQKNCSRDVAEEALRESGDDVIDALLICDSITSKRREIKKAKEEESVRASEEEGKRQGVEDRKREEERERERKREEEDKENRRGSAQTGG
jgi:NACalpha-BTF3-like transcription factor